MYAHHRGPSLAKPRWHDAPPDTGRSHWDGAEVGALLYGSLESGGCGIEHGSELDRALMVWATHAGESVERTSAIRIVERKLRDLLREHELMRPRTRAPAVQHWTDPDGAIWGSLGASSAACAAVA
jgi:hypothetical protein